MDELYLSSLELIALQGTGGCTLAKLWELLAGESGPQLPLTDGVKQALWRQLLQAAGEDVSFCIPRQEPEPSAKKGKKGKGAKGDEGDDELPEAASKGKGGKKGKKDDGVQAGKALDIGANELESLAAAEAAGVHVVASSELQDNAIGLYDARFTRFVISDLQRKTLEKVGEAGTRGALQNELCASQNQDNRSFFYVVKNLQQRGLLTKRPALVQKTGPINYFNTSKVTTNILHLVRFAPDLDKEIRFVNTDPSHASVGLDERRPMGEEELFALDERGHFHRVCSQLRGQEGQQAAESELKLVLGYKGNKGHRVWRRIKQNMQKRGLLEEFVGTMKGKAVKVIKMAKDIADEAEGGLDSDEEEGVEDADGSIAGQQVAELTMDRQIFRLLISAGHEGIDSLVLSDRLALSTKRAAPRLRELEVRFGIKGQLINKGRAKLILYKASELMLREHQDNVLPLEPRRGWLGAVQKAIEAGLEDWEPFPSLGLGGEEQEQQPRLAGEGPNALELEALLGGGEELSGPADLAGMADIAAASAAAEPGEAFTAAIAQPHEAFAGAAAQAGEAVVAAEHSLGDDSLAEAEVSGSPAAGASGVPGLQRSLPMLILASPADERPQAPGVRQQRKSVIQSRRVHWLIEKLEQDGFVLSAELPRYLKEREEAEEARLTNAPDRKTVNRVIEVAAAAGRVQSFQIAMPTTYGGLQTRSHVVVVKPGTEQTVEFFDRVFQYYKEFMKRIRQEAAPMRIASGGPLPEVELQSLLQPKAEPKGEEAVAPASEGAARPSNKEEPSVDELATKGERSAAADSLKQTALNGFCLARLERAKILHDVVLRLAGMGGHPAIAGGREAAVAAAGDAAGSRGGEAEEAGAAVGLRAGPEAAPEAMETEGEERAEGGAASPAPAEGCYLISVLPGQEGAHSRLDVQALPVDDPRMRYSVTSQQVWEGLTVMQYRNIIGSGTKDTARLEELTATGKTVGELSQAEKGELYGPEASHGDRPMLRLSQLLDILGKLGLLSSVVPLGPSARFGLSGMGATSFIVCSAGVIQEPTPKPADSEMAPPPMTHSIDLSTAEGFQRYWACLQYMVIRYTTPAIGRGRAAKLGPLHNCFPYDRAAELAIERSWAKPVLEPRALAEMNDLLDQKDAGATSLEGCLEIAARLGVPVQGVLSQLRALHRERQLHMARLGALGSAGGDGDKRRLGGVRRRLGGVRAVPSRKKRSDAGERRPVRRRRAGTKAKAAVAEGRLADVTNLVSDKDDDDEESEGGEEGEAEPVEVDRKALMPEQPALPLRKKKWHAHEDMRLLAAWAGFLAHKGLDKALIWKRVKGRPRLKASTCRHRVKHLKDNDLTGPAVLKIRETAAAVYERHVLRQVEQEEQELAPQQQGIFTPRGAATAAAAAPASQGQAAAQPASTAGKRRADGASLGSGVGASAVGSPDGDTPSENAAKRFRLGGEGAAAATPSEQPVCETALAVLKPLFPVEDDADRAALQEVARLIEQVVSLAPKRYKEVAVGIKPRPGPKPGFRKLGIEVETMAGKPLVARTLMRQWALGANLLPEGERPSTAVTAAAELVKSMLLIGAEKGTMGEGSERALVERFTEGEIHRAFGLLTRQGLLNPSGKGKRAKALQLSDRFKAELQPLAFKPPTLDEATKLKATLAQEGEVVVSSAPGAESAFDSLDGSTMATALELMAQGKMEVLPHQVSATLPPAALAPGATSRQAAAQQFSGQLEVAIPVRLRLVGGALPARRTVLAAPQPVAEELLFQPSLVAASSAVRGEAEAAAEAASVTGGVPTGALAAALAAIREGGSDGLPMAGLTTAVGGLLGIGDAMSAEVAGGALRVLLQHGLVRRVSGWDDLRYVASERSQGMLAYPLVAERDAEDRRTKEVEGMLEAAGLPPQGQPQPCMDCPIRPWLDNHGQLNASMWAGLVKRATSVVMRHPGIQEELLIAELGSISPSYARELLALLVGGGVLRLKPARCSASCGGMGALAACFGKRQAKTGGGVPTIRGGVPGLQQSGGFYFLAPMGLV